MKVPTKDSDYTTCYSLTITSLMEIVAIVIVVALTVKDLTVRFNKLRQSITLHGCPYSQIFTYSLPVFK